MIAILGRGASLLKFKEFHHKFDEVVIVNNFNEEIRLLGASCFLGKKIRHVVGRGKNSLKNDLYNKLGIKKVQSNCFSLDNFYSKSQYKVKVKCLPKVMRRRGFPCLPWDVILRYKDSHDSACKLREFLELKYRKEILKNQKKSKSLRAWPTTGILAIDHSLVTGKFKTVYLFGFDFYDNNYMIKQNASYQNKEWAKSKVMKYYLSELFNEFYDVSFFCSSDFMLKSDRWQNI
tara:strand:+ start:1551 stop:2249 length:699 start_codon:yes stop_codon:yes gene_type:complete